MYFCFFYPLSWVSYARLFFNQDQYYETCSLALSFLLGVYSSRCCIKSLIYFGLILWMVQGIDTLSSCGNMWIYSFSNFLFWRNSLFPPSGSLDILVKDHLIVWAPVYFWIVFSSLLIYMFIFVPVPYHLSYLCNLIWN